MDMSVGNLFLQPGKGSLARHAGGYMADDASLMQLADDQIAQANASRTTLAWQRFS